MCWIFGSISTSKTNLNNLKKLIKHSEQRGKDSSGLIYFNSNSYNIIRADYEVTKLLKEVDLVNTNVVLGHSRLITNGLSDNQPVVRNNIAAIHNGIVVNEKEIWDSLTIQRELTIDSETIVAIAEEHFSNLGEISDLPSKILLKCKGIIACALIVPSVGKLLLFSNNGSLYIGDSGEDKYFASERYGLEIIGCKNITQIVGTSIIIDIPKSSNDFIITLKNI